MKTWNPGLSTTLPWEIQDAWGQLSHLTPHPSHLSFNPPTAHPSLPLNPVISHYPTPHPLSSSVLPLISFTVTFKKKNGRWDRTTPFIWDDKRVGTPAGFKVWSSLFSGALGPGNSSHRVSGLQDHPHFLIFLRNFNKYIILYKKNIQ